MRIFTRYILREITGYALLGGVLFTFILFMRYLLPLMELAVRGVASPFDILRLIAYLLPGFLSFTIPMAVLVGILLGLSRLAADSEITAMRASGLGVLSFVRIVSLFAAFFWIAGLANSLYIAPRAAQALLHYEDAAKTTQATVEIQPRVFYEDFKNYVLYAQDVIPGANGTAIWRHVFLADLTKPANPHIITANEATVLSGGSQTLRLELANGSRHDISLSNPGQYDISTFASTELPMQTGQQEEDSHLSRRDTPMHALALPRSLASRPRRRPRLPRPYQIELNYRFAYPHRLPRPHARRRPSRPLLQARRQRRRLRRHPRSGLHLLLPLLHRHRLRAPGQAPTRARRLGRQHPLRHRRPHPPPANLPRRCRPRALRQHRPSLHHASSTASAHAKSTSGPPRARHVGDGAVMQRLRRALRIRFPLILDEYVMGSFLRNFVLVLVSLTILFIIFTFFELIGDILRYRTPLVVVGDYLINLIPFILDSILPLCSLVAVLITFGTLNRNSELTAMKATGISLYRIVAPMLVVATLLSALLFFFDETYLPAANRRQEVAPLRDQRQARPDLPPSRPQVDLRPDRPATTSPPASSTTSSSTPTKTSSPTSPSSSSSPEPSTSPAASSPNPPAGTTSSTTGSSKTAGSAPSTANPSRYQPFTVATFPEIHEQPSYFKKEDRQSEQMSYTELASYIRDLKQSGFDTMRLRVQLNRKLAYPLMTLVLAILAIPFALFAGKRSTVAGIGTAIGVAICYWVIAGIFENLGDVNSLPAVLAAWSPDLLFAIAGTYLLLRTPT